MSTKAEETMSAEIKELKEFIKMQEEAIEQQKQHIENLNAIHNKKKGGNEDRVIQK
ncbi:MAG: hypothetical protein Q8O92_16245 [Candidatus Latescibacter sp.]|nr:hypothetical protein [Candidatus Latescibacter sp.]